MQADNCIGITEKNHYRKVLTDGIVNFDRQGLSGCWTNVHVWGKVQKCPS